MSGPSHAACNAQAMIARDMQTVFNRMEAAGGIRSPTPAKLYEVNINAEMPRIFLGWDKPLGEQPQDRARFCSATLTYRT